MKYRIDKSVLKQLRVARRVYPKGLVPVDVVEECLGKEFLGVLPVVERCVNLADVLFLLKMMRNDRL